MVYTLAILMSSGLLRKLDDPTLDFIYRFIHQLLASCYMRLASLAIPMAFICQCLFRRRNLIKQDNVSNKCDTFYTRSNKLIKHNRIRYITCFVRAFNMSINISMKEVFTTSPQQTQTVN